MLWLGGGCGTTGVRDYFHNGLKVGPNYGRPPAPRGVRPGSRRSTRASETCPAGTAADWWSVFNDPTLSAMIQMAYEQNPNLRAVGARVLEARAGQAIAVGNLLPQTQQAQANYAAGQPQPEHAGHQSARLGPAEREDPVRLLELVLSDST